VKRIINLKAEKSRIHEETKNKKTFADNLSANVRRN
jgi:hypothetical protein